MPRDFVPRLYHEWSAHDPVRDVVHWRYDVIELFDIADRITQQPYLTMTRNSHAFHVGTVQSDIERLVTIERKADLVQAARTRLFTTFDAAMAALE